MAGYLIVDVRVTDAAAYERYKAAVGPTLVPFGGRALVRGGRVDTLEGDWSPSRIVVIEFPSMEKAKAWWSSEEYAPLKKLRQSAATTRLIAVEGVE